MCGPVYEAHPEIFRDHFDNEYLLMIVFVMHHMLIGEKSFWHPFWQIVNMSDMPMRWEEDEIDELQDAHLQKEVRTFRDEYFEEFNMVFDVFYNQKYEQVWPGICDTSKTKEEIAKEMEPMFYKCFNTIVTRCFGWGLPKTSLIPFADCINHHNVDSTYEFICQELHQPLRHLVEEQDTYNINIDNFVAQNKEILGLDNPTESDMQDSSYYTKSKMMFDISDLYLADDDEDNVPDVRSEKLTNRSIHTIKKMLIRQEASKVTVAQLLASDKNGLNHQNDIWELDYKSTSDEEDNDSSDEENPKPRI